MFRSQFGITSHSTPIDVPLNSRLIGFALFYALFASIKVCPLCARYTDIGCHGSGHLQRTYLLPAHSIVGHHALQHSSYCALRARRAAVREVRKTCALEQLL